MQAAFARVQSSGPAGRDDALLEFQGLLDELEAQALDQEDVPEELARALVLGAALEAQLDLPAPAWDALEDRLELAQELAAALPPGSDDELLRRRLLFSRAVHRNRMDRPREALECLESLPVDPPTVEGVQALLLKGELERQLGRWADASRTLEQAGRDLDALRLPEDTDGLLRLNLYNIRATVDRNRGLPDRAYHWISLQQELVEQIGTPQARRLALLVATGVGLGAERFDEVQWSIDAALANPEAFALTAEDLALLRVRRVGAASDRAGLTEEELGALGEELRQVLEAEDLPLAEHLLGERLWFDLLLRQGRHEEAREHFEAQSRLLAAYPSESSSEHSEAAAALVADEARLFLASAPTPPADPVAHRRELLSLLERLDSAYASLLSQWEQTPLEEGGVGFLYAEERRAVPAELVRVMLALDGSPEGRARALEPLLRAQAQGSLSRILGLPAGSLEEVRAQLLAPDQGLVLYLPGLDRTYGFAVDQVSVEVAELVAREELDAPCRDLNALLVRPASGARREQQERELASLQEKLGRSLFPEPLASRLRHWKSVLLVGGDLLGRVPFEALRIEGSPPLGLSHAVTSLPSVAVGLALAGRGISRSAQANVDLVLLAEPRGSGRGPAPLMLRPEQLHRLTQPFGPRVAVFAKERATPEALRLPLVPEASVLHLLAHGVQDPSRVLPAGILLAPTGSDPEGVLWAEEVSGLRVPPLVILSACGAARGPMRRGEDGIQHLGGAFLRAGARCVVLSTVDLQLDPTVELMAVLHERLVRGDSPAEALRRARLAVSSREDTAHPYFHATIRAFGWSP